LLAHPDRYQLNEPQRCAALAAFKDAGETVFVVVPRSRTPNQFQSYARYEL